MIVKWLGHVQYNVTKKAYGQELVGEKGRSRPLFRWLVKVAETATFKGWMPGWRAII